MLDTSIFTCFTHILSHLVSQNIRFDRVSLPWICFHYKLSIQSLCLQMCPNLSWIVNCQQPPTLMSLLHKWSWRSTPVCLLVWHQLGYEWTATAVWSCQLTAPELSLLRALDSVPGNWMTTRSHGLKPMQWGSFRHITSLRLTNMSYVITVTVLYISHNTELYVHTGPHRRKIDNCDRGWQVFRPIPSSLSSIHTTPLHYYNCWLWLLRWCIRPLRQLLHHCDRPITQVTNTLPQCCCLEPALQCSRFRFPPKPNSERPPGGAAGHWTGLVC